MLSTSQFAWSRIIRKDIFNPTEENKVCGCNQAEIIKNAKRNHLKKVRRNAQQFLNLFSLKNEGRRLKHTANIVTPRQTRRYHDVRRYHRRATCSPNQENVSSRFNGIEITRASLLTLINRPKFDLKFFERGTKGFERYR